MLLSNEEKGNRMNIDAAIALLVISNEMRSEASLLYWM